MTHTLSDHTNPRTPLVNKKESTAVEDIRDKFSKQTDHSGAPNSTLEDIATALCEARRQKTQVQDKGFTVYKRKARESSL
jgi:hypothetical protein